MQLNIVLINPQIPQNTGNVARTCAATGANLHLVKPMGFEITDKNLKRAGLDYWNKLNVTIYESLTEFLERTKGEEYWLYETKSPYTHCDVSYKNNCYLLFGHENTGLPVKLLQDYRNSCVEIPMRQGLRSLNMSNCVAVGVYEVLRQWNFPMLSANFPPNL